jgi:predicted DNA binding CopG/RHH family protein
LTKNNNNENKEDPSETINNFLQTQSFQNTSLLFRGTMESINLRTANPMPQEVRQKTLEEFYKTPFFVEVLKKFNSHREKNAQAEIIINSNRKPQLNNPRFTKDLLDALEEEEKYRKEIIDKIKNPIYISTLTKHTSFEAWQFTFSVDKLNHAPSAEEISTAAEGNKYSENLISFIKYADRRQSQYEQEIMEIDGYIRGDDSNNLFKQ